MRTKPEKLNGHVIRPTYRYPGGPVVGVIVMRGRKLVGAFNPQGRFSIRSAWSAARRVACGRTRRWDEMYLIPWNRARRPDWLEFFGRTAVIGDYRKRGDCIAFDRRTGLAPRPLNYRCYR
jgi:hypothetical protein